MNQNPAHQSGSMTSLIEEHLDQSLPDAQLQPRTLHRAMREAVFSGGKRLRPHLLLEVAQACSAPPADYALALRAACAIELIHSASLVHDDLPCFDNALERRGRPSVHYRYGEAIAVLAGDALLTRAFELLAEAPSTFALRTLRLIRLFGKATGSSYGIIGGQSLEQVMPGEVAPRLSTELLALYHDMKTATLFRLATEAGAVAAGGDGSAWAPVGRLIGTWYQLADDLIDTRGQAAFAKKPVRRDGALGRPNAVLALGEEAVAAAMRAILDDLCALMPQLTSTPAPLLALMKHINAQVQQAVAPAPLLEKTRQSQGTP